MGSFNANRVYWDGLPTGAQSGGASDVDVTNQAAGSIQTSGNNSAAIMALSVGAGYGSGSVTVDNAGTLLTTGANAPVIVGLSRVFQVSGVAVSADAAPVSITNSGSVVSSGVGSSGIIAVSQSSVGASGNVSVSNDGGSVFITDTSTTSASGIALSSLAAGTLSNSGNLNLTNISGSVVTSNTGTDPAILGETTSASGNSGSITFDNTGGYVSSKSSGGAVVLLSSALAGNSGDITVTSASSIISQAVGSTALSLTSTGQTTSTSGDISLTNGGLIQGGASGTAIAIFGGLNNLVINNGSLSSAGELAIIQTSGTVFDTVITATSGNDAIQNLNGARIVGSVNLGAGLNSFLNGTGSLFAPGNEVFLGAGNTLTNNGFFSPGGTSTVMSTFSGINTVVPSGGPGVTLITGNFIQGSTGQLVMDVLFTRGAGNQDYADFVQITGTANLLGYVTLNPASGAGKPGQYSIPMLSAAGGMSFDPSNPLTVFPTFASGTPSTTIVFTPSLSIVVTNNTDSLNYNLLYEPSPNQNTLYLNYSVDYSPSSLGMTPNQRGYANQVNNIQTQGVSDYQPVADALLNISDPNEYRRALDSLTGEGIAATQQATFGLRSQFFDALLKDSTNLLDCPRFLTKDQCDTQIRSWASIDRRSTTRFGDSNPSAPNWTASSYNIATTNDTAYVASFGEDRKVAHNAVVGFAMGFASSSISVPDRFTKASITGVNFGVHGTLRMESGAYLKGLLGYGYFDNSTDRYAIGNRVLGNYSTETIGSKVEVGFTQRFNNLQIVPFINAQVDRLKQPQFSETDATWGNTFDGINRTSKMGSIGLKINGNLITSNGWELLPNITLSSVYEGNTSRGITVAPVSAPDFKSDISAVDAEKNFGQADIGLTVNVSKLSSFALRYVTSWSTGYKSGSTFLSFSQRF